MKGHPHWILLGVVVGVAACTTRTPVRNQSAGLNVPAADPVASPFGQGPFLVRGVGVEYQPTYVELHDGWLLLKWFDAQAGRYTGTVWMPVPSVVAVECLPGK